MFENSDFKQTRDGLGPHKTIPSTIGRKSHENYLHEPIRTGFEPQNRPKMKIPDFGPDIITY